MNTYQRAIQIYQVLISAAHHRQTMTYENLGSLIGMPAWALGNHLDHLLQYCKQKDLPLITVLVVQKGAGNPSTGFPEDVNAAEERERVFNFEWFKRPPITEDELKA